MRELCDDVVPLGPRQQIRDLLHKAVSIGFKDPFLEICVQATWEVIDYYSAIITFSKRQQKIICT